MYRNCRLGTGGEDAYASTTSVSCVEGTIEVRYATMNWLVKLLMLTSLVRSSLSTERILLPWSQQDILENESSSE